MIGAIRHRGPDGTGMLEEPGIALGSARSSIIDLAGGKQPLANEDGSVWTALNGEIFNHLELRARLQTRRHVFRTRSDTEVLVHAYEELGTRCVEELNGDFAFALWDRTRRRLMLARDRVGILSTQLLHHHFIGDANAGAYGKDIGS
jgi:asparagine synthase (glutamine-hydrolysing)